MDFKTDIALKFYASFVRTGNPYFYVLAVDAEKTEALRQTVHAKAEAEDTLSL